MPRNSFIPPKFTHHRASGQARVRIGGVDRYLGEWGSREALDSYADLLKSRANPDSEGSTVQRAEVATGQGTPLGKIAVEFLAWARGYYTKAGAETSEIAVIRHVLRRLCAEHARTPATAFTARTFKEFRAGQIEAGRSRSGINRDHRIIARMLRWAASEELVPASIADGVRMVPALRAGRTAAKELPAVKPVDDETVSRTLAAIKDPGIATLLRVQRLCGARIGEMLAITRDGLDTTGDDVWRFEYREHKTAHKGKARTIYFGARCIELLRPIIMKTTPAGKLFPYRADSIRNTIKRAAIRAGVEPWTPHQLRHARATELRREAGLSAAQVTLGHANISMTQHYAEANESLALDIARKLG